MRLLGNQRERIRSIDTITTDGYCASGNDCAFPWLCYNVIQTGQHEGVEMQATMTIRMEEDEKSLISEYARMFGTSASQFMRRCALEHIEDEIDVEAYKRAKAAYDAHPVSYTLEEVEEMLGL